MYCQAGWRAPLPRFGLIGAGALGNPYERVFVGVIVDHLDVFVGRDHWLTFNVADAAITVGIGLLVLSTLRAPGSSERPILIPYSRADELRDRLSPNAQGEHWHP